jgi:hypothetical protein
MVDPHIGALELKTKAWNVLEPLWIQWSHGYSLKIDQLKLRHQKGFIEIVDEVDAIWHYLKKKANAKTTILNANQDISLYLVVNAMDFENADFHRMNTPLWEDKDPEKVCLVIFYIVAN